MIFAQLKRFVLYVYILLIPFIFFPLTQDVFMVPKWLFTSVVVLVLIGLSIIEFVFSKKIRWETEEFDSSILLFVIAVAVSLIIGSVNKVQALVSVQFGLVTFVILGLLYFYISRLHIPRKILFLLFYTVGILFAVATFVSYIPALTGLLQSSVAGMLAFNTPAGNPAETMVLLGFMWFLLLGSVVEIRSNWKMLIVTVGGLAVVSIALVVVGLSIVTNRTVLVLPSFTHSWYAVLEVFKAPLSAFFGAGIGNFTVVFPRVKDAEFLAGSYWQLSSFTFSRSLIFHITTELGLLGLAAFILMVGSFVKRVFTTERGHMDRVIALFFVAASIVAPPTFMFFILFFVWAGYSAQKSDRKHIVANVTEIPVMHIAIIIVAMLAVGGAVMGLSRIYMAEYLYKQALSTTNLKSAYDTMRLAVFQNPYDERIRTGYVGVHMLVANTIAEKAQTTDGASALSEQDKQTISQAIQAAIEEAKAVVSLNPRKAANWDVLATVYKNILPLAQGADAWALSAYQRAIVLDPQNPTYRLALGGVYYQLKQYDEAMRSFEQAAMLKNDWPNAQYNYAWAAYQKGDYQRAALAMQSTVSLIDPKLNEADYKKAQADLEEFKQKLPEGTQPPTEPTSENQSSTLTLPPEPAPVDEKINLPDSASPSATAP